MAGIDLIKNKTTGEKFSLKERMGKKVCDSALKAVSYTHLTLPTKA